jgi:hypothetical protein
LIIVLVASFFKRYLSIVGAGYGENPTSDSNSLDLKVTTVRALSGFNFSKEFLSEQPFCHFSRKKS